MHGHDPSLEALTDAIVRYAVERIAMNPPPLDAPRDQSELRTVVDGTITASGIGGLNALERFAVDLAPACISTDHPRFLSFVPAAPTEASVLFDLVVGASSIYAGSWMEGGGAIAAENAALRWIADLAGMPMSAGGVFVSGGTAGNLSALMAARWRWRARAGGRVDSTRALIVTSSGAHSSIAQAGMVMDADVLAVAAEDDGRLGGDALAAALEALDGPDRDRVCAVVATAGTTNAGIVDDLAGIAAVSEAHDLWFHVDAAYGGAALAAPSVRARFDGVERADSLIVDPHKWLFAPFDSCALLYRDPEIAKAAHTQHAEYLDVLHDDDVWNASDYAHHLSRRARGLPLWFSLATYGTDAYVAAIEQTLATAHAAADLIRDDPSCELVLEPQLSVVVFRRLGWGVADYATWSAALLDRGQAFVVPTAWQGETVLRICIVNPLTTTADIADLIESLH
ncbi:MAG: aminotransferase class V-fold PLP-dependent enzyme [Acidimicrobiales bacterium]